MATSATSPAAPGAGTVAGEHDIQLQLLGAVEHAVRAGHRFDDVMSLLDQLIEYTSVHFHSEELMMRLYAYPQYQAHCAEHAELMQQVRAIRESFREQDREGLLETAGALRDWLGRHIDGKDHGLVTFLNRQATSPG